MKDLILIISYVPDIIRQNLLSNLVNDLKNKDYDIMISSHSFIPKDIFDNVDYVIYEKENILLTDISDKNVAFFSNNDFIVRTTEVNEYNHAITAFKLITLGLSNAKNLGYNKVHMFEYDVRVKKMDEIKENTKLLDEYNVVFYVPQGIENPNSPISYNLNKISKDFFDITNEKIFNYFNSNGSDKTAEQYHKKLLNESEKIYKKILINNEINGIFTHLHSVVPKYPWVVCVYDKTINKLVLFARAKNELNGYEIHLIINKTKHLSYNVPANCWILRNIEEYDKVENVLIIVNGELRQYLDFSKINKDTYKQKNNIQHK